MDLQIAFIIIWASVFAILLIVELSTTQLVSIWFCGGALVSLVLAIFNVPIFVQCIVFVVVSAILLLATRPFIKKTISAKTIHTNTDSLIGEEILVTSSIKSKEEPGEGKINDIYWTLVADLPIKEGQYAIIKAIKGNKLIVTKKGEK